MPSRIRSLFMVLAGLSLMALPAGAQSQIQVSGEGRVGVALPLGDLSDEGAEAGLALGAELMFTFQRNLSAYVALNRHAFSCEQGCDLGDNLRSTGVGAGLKYIVPGPSDAQGWFRGGVVSHRLTSDDANGSRNLGFEIGAGFDMPVRPRLHLVPHLSLISHDAGNVGTASYLNLGIGLHYHFN